MVLEISLHLFQPGHPLVTLSNFLPNIANASNSLYGELFISVSLVVFQGFSLALLIITNALSSHFV